MNYNPDADPLRSFMCDEPGCDKRAMFGEDVFLLKGTRGTWRCIKHWRQHNDAKATQMVEANSHSAQYRSGLFDLRDGATDET